MELKDDPINMLKKDEVRFLALLVRPMHLTTMCCCCYAAPNKYDLYKWVPNHKQYDKFHGRLDKRILKIKEHASYLERACMPSSCRGYSGYYMA